MVRIISGSKRGKNILTLAGEDTRPTLDRVRESVFNLIQFRVFGSKILDLFSGSGAFALECISRGAEYACVCDNNADAVEIIKKNLASCGFDAKIFACEYAECLSRLAHLGARFDLIYVDPPYDSLYYDDVLKRIADYGILDEDGIIICESKTGAKFRLPEGFSEKDRRRYGKTDVTQIVKTRVAQSANNSEK